MNINNIKHNGMSLQAIIHRHAQRLQGENDWIRADLSRADLRGADLSGADLSGADLSDAYMRDADLSDADLSDAGLRGADLRGADLRGADLRGADLCGADLSDAYMRDAYLSGAYLSGADLSDAYMRDADLSDADLSDADLSGAYLSGADMRGALHGVPQITDIHQSVYNAASPPQALEMRTWHTCETTHCRAGWVISLASDAGRALESSIGTSAAAALIYMSSDPTLERVPNFHASNEDAMADMKRLAEAEANQKRSEA